MQQISMFENYKQVKEYPNIICFPVSYDSKDYFMIQTYETKEKIEELFAKYSNVTPKPKIVGFLKYLQEQKIAFKLLEPEMSFVFLQNVNNNDHSLFKVS